MRNFFGRFRGESKEKEELEQSIEKKSAELADLEMRIANIEAALEYDPARDDAAKLALYKSQYAATKTQLETLLRRRR